MSTCICMGPQNGAPLCPCRMRQAEAAVAHLQASRVLPSDPALANARLPSDWREIATAKPEDNHILACDARQSFGWINGRQLPPVQTTVHWFEFGDDSGWYTSVNEIEPQRPFPATHWKPLDGPAESSADDGGDGVPVHSSLPPALLISRLQHSLSLAVEALGRIANRSVLDQKRREGDTDAHYFLRCFAGLQAIARAALSKLTESE